MIKEILEEWKSLSFVFTIAVTNKEQKSYNEFEVNAERLQKELNIELNKLDLETLKKYRSEIKHLKSVEGVEIEELEITVLIEKE